MQYFWGIQGISIAILYIWRIYSDDFLKACEYMGQVLS